MVVLIINCNLSGVFPVLLSRSSQKEISKFNQPFLRPEQEGIDMGEHKSMGGDCMCWSRKRGHRGRFGILLIVIGLLWIGQRAGWFL